MFILCISDCFRFIEWIIFLSIWMLIRCSLLYIKGFYGVCSNFTRSAFKNHLLSFSRPLILHVHVSCVCMFSQVILNTVWKWWFYSLRRVLKIQILGILNVSLVKYVSVQRRVWLHLPHHPLNWVTEILIFGQPSTFKRLKFCLCDILCIFKLKV